MELKDFIKGVISDVTNAIKESQDELKNGAVISPPINQFENGTHKIYMDDDYFQISTIDFEVAVTVGNENKTDNSAGIGINVISAFIGAKGSENNKQINEDISKVKFSIPVVYPHYNK